jgi:hypothetical protein
MKTSDADLIIKLLQKSNPPTLENDYKVWSKKISIAVMMLEMEKARVRGAIRKMRKENEQKRMMRNYKEK